jgi:hypothetical protein
MPETEKPREDEDVISTETLRQFTTDVTGKLASYEKDCAVILTKRDWQVRVVIAVAFAVAGWFGYKSTIDFRDQSNAAVAEAIKNEDVPTAVKSAIDKADIPHQVLKAIRDQDIQRQVEDQVNSQDIPGRVGDELRGAKDAVATQVDRVKKLADEAEVATREARETAARLERPLAYATKTLRLLLVVGDRPEVDPVNDLVLNPVDTSRFIGFPTIDGDYQPVATWVTLGEHREAAKHFMRIVARVSQNPQEQGKPRAQLLLHTIGNPPTSTISIGVTVHLLYRPG